MPYTVKELRQDLDTVTDDGYDDFKVCFVTKEGKVVEPIYGCYVGKYNNRPLEVEKNNRYFCLGENSPKGVEDYIKK